jgi:hypothetical protein
MSVAQKSKTDCVTAYGVRPRTRRVRYYYTRGHSWQNSNGCWNFAGCAREHKADAAGDKTAAGERARLR